MQNPAANRYLGTWVPPSLYPMEKQGLPFLRPFGWLPWRAPPSLNQGVGGFRCPSLFFFFGLCRAALFGIRDGCREMCVCVCVCVSVCQLVFSTFFLSFFKTSTRTLSAQLFSLLPPPVHYLAAALPSSPVVCYPPSGKQRSTPQDSATRLRIRRIAATPHTTTTTTTTTHYIQIANFRSHRKKPLRYRILFARQTS